MKRTISLLTVLLGVCVIAAGCGGTATGGEPDFAVPVVETALKSLSGGDYETYLSLWDDESKQFLTEEAFTQSHEFITGKIGEYRRKTYIKEAMESGYTVVYYEAEFTGEPEKVAVRAVFIEDDGEMKLAGFWLDSPGMHQQ